MNIQYRKLTYIKKGNGVNLVKLSSVYDNNCSAQEYKAVDDRVLDFMIENDRYIEKLERADRSNIAVSYNDEIGNCNNAAGFSHSEKYYYEREEEQQKIRDHLAELKAVFDELSDKQRSRIYLFVYYEMSYTEIAKYEGVSAATVQSTCERAFSKLREYSDILQKDIVESWIDLLKPTNFKITFEKRQKNIEKCPYFFLLVKGEIFSFTEKEKGGVKCTEMM